MIRKLLISAVSAASLALIACSSLHLPAVYKVDVPQGNIITQEMVNQLQPGMSKRQVSFAMGTPLIMDTFHPDRWDYIYSYQPGKGKSERHHVTLYFNGDKLTRIEGDYRPKAATASTAEPPKETTVTVTPPPPERGFFGRIWDSLRGKH